jgi:hypothetical protein
MWQLDNRTPFAAERSWVRDRDGAEIWLVAVKCTFGIKPDGGTEIATEQPPIVMAPEYMNPALPGQSSLRYDSDMVRTKTTTDVVVVGHAYAPRKKPVRELDVGFRIGPLVKQLHITGDRIWLGGSPSEPLPFTKLPLVYERAYGGYDRATLNTASPEWDARNPVGIGFAVSASSAGGQRLPNVEYRDQLIRSWRDRPRPAGFGPIGAHWQPRGKLAGTYDDEWQQERFPLLPDDFDDRHYQCVPSDQQARKFLTGGETVRLVNLTPAGILDFRLPRLFLGFETSFYTGEREIHDRPKLHTVIIEPDFPRVSLVWHSALPCHPKVLKLKETRIFQKQLLSRRGPEDDSEEEAA